MGYSELLVIGLVFVALFSMPLLMIAMLIWTAIRGEPDRRRGFEVGQPRE